KQYAYGKGPDFENETAKLKTENRQLKQQIEILKKYKELESKWYLAKQILKTHSRMQVTCKMMKQACII
ncbi:hypothetical protein, partial [Priestia flexa]|uniref:hypothetical protein n=2 Tax=Priestia flexa TaxID=86664 RepID=UPI001C951DB7